MKSFFFFETAAATNQPAPGPAFWSRNPLAVTYYYRTTGIYPAPILDKASETQVNNISIVIRRDTAYFFSMPEPPCRQRSLSAIPFNMEYKGSDLTIMELLLAVHTKVIDPILIPLKEARELLVKPRLQRYVSLSKYCTISTDCSCHVTRYITCSSDKLFTSP